MTLFTPDLDAPQWQRLSNGPARLDLEGFSHSSREKPVNTVKNTANSNKEPLKLRSLLDRPKEKQKFDEDLQNNTRGVASGKTKAW
jgi:hypothetical protein